MKIPSEAELIEMERRYVRLIERSEMSRERAEKLAEKAEDQANDRRKRDQAKETRRRAGVEDDWADFEERIAADIDALVSMVRELAAVSK